MSAAAASSPSSSTKRLEGKVALVTGGANGIGEAIVRLFVEHGAKVCIADVQDESGQQLRDAVGGGDNVTFVHCDVTVEEDVSAAVDAAVERFGALDVMVNNAGVTGSKGAGIRDVDFAEVRRVFDVNVHGVFLGMKHAARAMVPRRRGSIVSLASVASVLGGTGPHAYTGSKHAVVGLTKSVAAELGRHGVRVNCVSPYAVPTALSMPHLDQGARADDALGDFLAFVGGEANLKGVDLMPKDVAEAVLYLASDDARLEGKVALVTGGATGIGEAIVRLFREHGAKVCIADIQDEAGQRLRDALGDQDVMFVHCDVTIEEDVSAAVDAAAGRFGALDVMVNNAGITGDKVIDIRDVDFAEVRKVFDINVHGVFLGMKHAARVMIPQKRGSIVSLASVASVIGGMGPHAYTASKHAVAGLTKSVAGELGRHGVRVNCVSPYAVPTALSMPHLPQSARAEDALKDFLAFIGSEANLKGVDLMPKDVAQAVLYLASDEARYVSALNLTVDGGFTAVNHNLKPFED